MNHRLFFTSCLLILLLGTAGALEAARGNIVMFVVDDQGRDAGCYGNKAIKTPNLDKLAADGTVFQHAYCTTASCSASRSVILTGLHNHSNGQYGHQHSYHNFHTRKSVRSLPVLLSGAGYRTASIGKYHVQPEEVYHFDTYLKGNQGGSRNAVTMAQKCRAWLGEKTDQPFFLYFCTSDPHRSGRQASHPLARPDFFGNGRKFTGVKEQTFKPEDVIVPSYLPDTIECRRELAQ
ncbi:MAG: sulfatase-like hydrolase/transferase, partial [Planctomycetota bacterium]|nr:sulfatase-like hydrolase/transferase [Planctomycetota bacterium]